MSKHANPTLIGAFVVCGVLLLAFAIIIFSGRELFGERRHVVMYFTGSVTGLEVGAPLNLRGVQVGTVTDINMLYESETGQLFVSTTAEINPDKFVPLDSFAAESDTVWQAQLRSLVENQGLRAQLGQQSLLTGLLYIELDYFPSTRIDYHGDGSLPEIPTKPSALEKLSKGLETFPIEKLLRDVSSAMDAINRLANAPELLQTVRALNTTLNDISVAMAGINRLTGAPEILQTTRSLEQTLRTIDSLANSVKKNTQPLAETTNEALRNARQALLEATHLFQDAHQLIAEDSPLVYNLNNALQELARAARAIRQLADTIERQPEILIRGKSRRDTE